MLLHSVNFYIRRLITKEYDPQKKTAGIVIHGFAGLHAATAFCLAQTLVGDTAALSVLTVAMIMTIARVIGVTLTIKDSLNVAGLMVGSVIGGLGAMMLVKWIPGIGNAANAIATTIVTELIGCTAFKIIKSDKPIKEITKEEINEFYKQAKAMRIDEKKEVEQLLAKMSSKDKKQHDAIIKKLKSRGISNDMRDTLISQLNDIIQKYEASTS